MFIDFIYMRMAYAVLLFTFLFCGVLRSLDFWKTLGKDADELYPARRTVTCVYFSVVVLLPCVLHPQSADAQLLARCFWILFVPAATALCYKRFFFGDACHKRLRVALVGGVPLAFMLALSCIALAGGDVLIPYRKTVIHATGLLGALLTTYVIHVMLWLWRIASGADTTARVTDELFPKRFALGMLLVSSLVLTVTWVVFLFGGLFAETVFTGIIALVGLGILFVILHPQRVKEQVGEGRREAALAVPDEGLPEEDTALFEVDDPVATDACCMEDEDTEDAIGDGEDVWKESALSREKKYLLSDAQLDNMERQIRKFVEGKRQYLDPKLTRKTLEEQLGVNHFYLSEVFARRFGSLTLYLNTLRMEHAIRYAAEHPDAKLAEVIHHSGFGSYNSYYRAKKAYETEKSSFPWKETDNEVGDSGLGR